MIKEFSNTTVLTVFISRLQKWGLIGKALSRYPPLYPHMPLCEGLLKLLKHHEGMKETNTLIRVCEKLLLETFHIIYFYIIIGYICVINLTLPKYAIFDYHFFN